MKDSFGGAFMIQLLLIFIIVFVSLLAIALNYTKAFRVKNGIIDILEQYQYDGTESDRIALEKVEDYLVNMSYANNNTKLKNDCETAKGTFVNGACIIPMSDRVDLGNYYRVITYIPFEFNFLNLNFYVSVSGETKVI